MWGYGLEIWNIFKIISHGSVVPSSIQKIIIKIQNHEDTVKYPESKYKDAFFAAMEEYNQYGIAEVSSRYRLDKTAMDELYGFKVAWC